VNNTPSHEAEYDQIEQDQISPWHHPVGFMSAKPAKNLVILVNTDSYLSA